jgi:hypothetical protein
MSTSSRFYIIHALSEIESALGSNSEYPFESMHMSTGDRYLLSAR